MSKRKSKSKSKPKVVNKKQEVKNEFAKSSNHTNRNKMQNGYNPTVTYSRNAFKKIKY